MSSTTPVQLRPCGTVAAYKRHHAHGEQPCQPCKDAATANRLRQLGRNPRKLHPCGTDGAYQRHLRHREVPCRMCCEAHKRKSRDRTARLKTQGEAMDTATTGIDTDREINYQRHLAYLFSAQCDAKEGARRAYAMGLIDLLRKAAAAGTTAITVTHLDAEFKKIHARATRANGSWRKDPEIAHCTGYGCTHTSSPQHPDTTEPTP